MAGNAHTAAKYYRKLIRAEPTMTTALLEGSRAFTLSGNPDAARKALKSVATIPGLSSEIKSLMTGKDTSSNEEFVDLPTMDDEIRLSSDADG